MDIKLPDSASLTSSLLRVLKSNPNGLASSEIDRQVTHDLKLTKEQTSLIHSGNRSEIAYRLAWCRTKAKKAGLISKAEGNTWKIVL